MPVVSSQRGGGELCIGDLLAEGVVAGVEVGFDPQAGAGGGGGDQLDDRAVGGERPAPPVDGDEREEAVLDFVPLGGARRMWQTVITRPMEAASLASSTLKARER
jgi:hypothetical protein